MLNINYKIIKRIIVWERLGLIKKRLNFFSMESILMRIASYVNDSFL